MITINIRMKQNTMRTIAVAGILAGTMLLPAQELLFTPGPTMGGECQREGKQPLAESPDGCDGEDQAV